MRAELAAWQQAKADLRQEPTDYAIDKAGREAVGIL